MNHRNKICLVCQFLQSARSWKRYSQEEVKHATGIDVSNYENNRCIPGLNNLMILCEFYNVSLPWLLASVEKVELGMMDRMDFLEYHTKAGKEDPAQMPTRTESPGK